jgi:ABC-type glutathione transport system ATPase component
MSAPPLLEARDLVVRYPSRTGGDVTALQDVSFVLERGERVAVIGESGSGKSTLVRALLRLAPLAAGQVLLKGEDLAILTPSELRHRRRAVQLIFQDPIASLDPRMRIADIVAEPLDCSDERLSPSVRRARVLALLESLGLGADALERRPHEFSGGQAQRIAITRALIADPAVLLCDEPVASLDLATRRQVLALLHERSVAQGLALLFISHDLPAVWRLCERVLVLYRGRVVEQGTVREVFTAPTHEYTRRLLTAVPVPDPERARARRASAR